jgi:hypothetical protein
MTWKCKRRKRGNSRKKMLKNRRKFDNKNGNKEKQKENEAGGKSE